MKTVKLYDKDSHIKDFTAKVLDCREKDGYFEIILDSTAFFPEGGGQSADTGKIGNRIISDVQIIDGEIVHYSDGAVEIGTTVNCSINWDKRFRRMQNHSGEHIDELRCSCIHGHMQWRAYRPTIHQNRR